MRLITYLMLLNFCLITTISLGQVSKTIHETFTLDAAKVININVVGSEIEIKETKGSRVLVETTIVLSVSNQRLLDFVANSGRYNLIKTLNPSTAELTLESKKTNNVIVVKGEECYEVLSYRFFMPETVNFVDNSTETTQDE